MKSDESKNELFAAIDQLVPDPSSVHMLKTLVAFHSFNCRMEGFTDAISPYAPYVPLAVRMQEEQ